MFSAVLGDEGSPGDEFVPREAVPAFLHRSGERLPPTRLHRREGYAVLRPFGPRQGRLDCREVEVDDQLELRLRAVRGAEKVLRPEIGPGEFNGIGRAAGAAQVVDGDLVGGEETHCGPVFGCHVGEECSVRNGEGHCAGTCELDELIHRSLFAEDLRYRQHDIRGGNPGLRAAGKTHTDHRGSEHVERLPEHIGLRLDASDTPAEYAEAVNHRSMRIGPHERVGEYEPAGFRVRRPHEGRQILEVDLVADAPAGRHDAEVREGFLPPAQELVAFAVAFEFKT